jgi:hypothetical protein
MDVSDLQKITFMSKIGRSVTVLIAQQNKLDLDKIYGLQLVNTWWNLDIMHLIM